MTPIWQHGFTTGNAVDILPKTGSDAEPIYGKISGFRQDAVIVRTVYGYIETSINQIRPPGKRYHHYHEGDRIRILDRLSVDSSWHGLIGNVMGHENPHDLVSVRMLETGLEMMAPSEAIELAPEVTMSTPSVLKYSEEDARDLLKNVLSGFYATEPAKEALIQKVIDEENKRREVEDRERRTFQLEVVLQFPPLTSLYESAKALRDDIRSRHNVEEITIIKPVLEG